MTGRFVARKIVKPGPTGLITTSTKSLGEQSGTRVLEVPLDDSPKQTREVMKAHARAVALEVMDQGPDLEPYIALQRWIGEGGAHRVVVPFALALAERLPDKAVR